MIDALRRSRGPLVVGALVLLAAVVLTIIGARSEAGLLQPDAPDPTGAGALVAVLREQGVRVDVATRPEDVVGTGATVLVAFPARLGAAGRVALAHAGSDVVLVAPDPATLEVLAPGVRRTEPPPGLLTTGPAPGPACALPAARAAGPLTLAGDVYSVTPPAAGCYARADVASVAVSGRTVVVGDATPFTNAALDRSGNAALVMGLLGSRPRVVWYLPAPSADGRVSLARLVPPGWVWGTVQLLVAGVLVALWRGRRLGAPVAERLPVRVPAAETTRGRAALYQRIGARGRAAEVLRADARRRLAARLGVADEEIVLTAAVARGTGRAPGLVGTLLYGAEPDDDAALVALAGDLDDLTRGVV